MLQVAFPQAASPASEPGSCRAGQARTLLVVEDEPLIRELVLDAFDGEDGLDVLAAASAVEALQLVHARTVDLLFTDIDLGPGPDGFDLAQAARALRPGLDVVYTSGRLGGADVLRAVPGSVFLPKPYRPMQVRDRLRALLSVRPL